MKKGKRFNIVREVNHERVLDMYSAKGKFVQRVHWERTVEDDIVYDDSDSLAWTLFWNSLISAIVADATPTNVVMTFGTANTTLLASDFTIAGFTITSLSRDVTNKILTLTLSTAVIYGNSLTVILTKQAGFTMVVTNNVLNFRMTFDTELTAGVGTSSLTKTVVIPTFSNGYNCLVNWGDGLTTPYVGGVLNTAGTITHVYATAGIKTVSISGVFPQIYFNNVGDKFKLKTINNWGTQLWREMHYAFYGCSNMTGTYEDAPNTTAVTKMDWMFYNCSVFNSLVNFNTAAVTTMYFMLAGCSSFNKSVANFNTASVTDMGYMLYNCFVFNQSVANFNTVAVTKMQGMLYSCTSFKQSLASFNIANNINLIDFATVCNINAPGTSTNYDATLIAWSAQVPKPNITVNFGTSKYSEAGSAARAELIANHGWIITDGGLIDDLLLTSTGTGVGVSTIVMQVSSDVIVTVGANAKFYTDAAGTLGESSTWSLLSGADRVIYLKCTIGTATFSFSDITKLTRWSTWTNPVNSPTIGGEISRIINGTYFTLYGTNTMSGSIAGLLGLGLCEINSPNILYPNVTNLTGLSYLSIGPAVTLTSANVNQLLSDFWLNRNYAKIVANRVIGLSGSAGTGAPTGQGLIDKANLAAYRSPTPPGTAAFWTVSTRP